MKKILLLILLGFTFFCGKAQKYVINSPDKKLAAEIEINQEITVKLINQGEQMVNLSGLSLQTADNIKLTGILKVKKISRNSVNEEVKPQIRDKGETFKNNFNELNIAFKNNQAICLFWSKNKTGRL